MQSTVPFVVVPVLKLWLTTTQSIRGWLCRFNTQSCHHAEYCSVRGWFCRFNTRSFSRLFLVAHSASSSVLEEVNMSDEWSSVPLPLRNVRTTYTHCGMCACSGTSLKRI